MNKKEKLSQNIKKNIYKKRMLKLIYRKISLGRFFFKIKNMYLKIFILCIKF
jgi:hypothetical protein